MKKLILVSSLAIISSGCRYVNVKEPYLDAKENQKLEVPEEMDKPNQVSTLNVPKAASSEKITEKPDNTPPDMPIRTRQSQDSLVKIENQNEFPVLVVRNNFEKAWNAMETISLENWTVKSASPDSCEVNLHYNDSAARDRENAGFIKKIFTRDNYYSDYTGDYLLKCKKLAKTTEVKFQQNDGSRAKTFLADSVMSALFDSLSGDK